MKIKQCNRCIMDSIGDPSIKFFKDGTCNYCNYAYKRLNKTYMPNEKGQQLLWSTIAKIKEENKLNKYDCIMGISGGLDSAYLAYLGSAKWGLRILGVHIDDGFDSDLAKNNIDNLCKYCNIELINYKPDEEQFIDLTRSFFLASLPGLCIPQDNVLVAELFKIAKEKNLSYFLSGTNFALESILQRGNMHNAYDIIHIKDVHNKFGKNQISNLTLLSMFERYIYYKYFKRQHYIRPLDWIDYNKENAIKELEQIGFKYYEGKHYESILTRFLQVYYLPKKFNLDIRKSHISSLIISGQLTREEALVELSKPLYDDKVMQEDIDFVIKKFNLSRSDFEAIMNNPPLKHEDFKISKLNHLAGFARRFRNFLSS